jgi:tripartite ATP-independent transporter DctP family solute receptor
MKLNRRSLIQSAGAGVALFAIGGKASAQANVMRFGHPHPTSDSWQTASLQFAEKVKAKTGGKIEIQVFPNGALGSDPQMISAVRGGTLDITLTGNPFFTGMAPKLNVLDLPFLFKDRAHVAKVLDGAIGDGLRKDLEGSNLKALATWEVGWRNLTNSRRPVANAADIKGLKIRTTPNPAHVKAFQLLGAVPTPMPFTELFTALETKTVDGQENPVTLILNAKFYEVQKHLSLTKHAFTSAPLVMNNDKFKALAPDLQQALVSTAAEMAAAQRKMNEDAEGSSLDALKKAGMQAVEKPDTDSFSKIVTEEVRKEFVAKYGSDVLDAIIKAG